jgi:hypothetical protein
MDNLDDLKAIWLTAKTDHLPTSEEVISMSDKFRHNTLIRKIVIIISACLVASLMLAVMIFYKSTMLSTWIGEGLIILSCILLAATNVRSIGRFYKFQACSNYEFLQFLEKTKQNQLRYYKKTQVIGQVLSSAGLLVYLYEFTCKNTIIMIVAYGVVLAYLSVMWFVIRPSSFKKNFDRLCAIQKRVEKLVAQLNEE